MDILLIWKCLVLPFSASIRNTIPGHVIVPHIMRIQDVSAPLLLMRCSKLDIKDIVVCNQEKVFLVSEYLLAYGYMKFPCIVSIYEIS